MADLGQPEPRLSLLQMKMTNYVYKKARGHYRPAAPDGRHSLGSDLAQFPNQSAGGKSLRFRAHVVADTNSVLGGGTVMVILQA